jgi:ubiquitin-conjugating enzyme E2 Q
MSAIDLTNTSSDEEDDKAPAAAAAPPAKRRRTSGGGVAAQSAAMVDLTDDDPPGAAAAAKPADDKPPPWLRQSGVRRIMAEFRALTDALKARPGSLGALRRLWLPDEDNLLVWRMECSGFDEDLQGGRDINADLASLSRDTGGGASSIVMEAKFPPTYPTQPFFLRVVTPRMVMYTGHVTAGGSICVEALTNTGTPNSWQRTFTFENIFLMVLHNMIDVEPMVVRTATGPGGRSGPLRVDLRQGARYCTSEYVCPPCNKGLCAYHHCCFDYLEC